MKIVLKDGQMDRSQTTGDLKKSITFDKLVCFEFCDWKVKLKSMCS